MLMQNGLAGKREINFHGASGSIRLGEWLFVPTAETAALQSSARGEDRTMFSVIFNFRSAKVLGTR